MDRLKDIILQVTPRILGFIDRDSTSKTYGCCDRYFWHYKLHDVANARFQEICLFLTLLYINEFEGNFYFRKEKMLEWIRAIVVYWLSMNRSGFVSELYPYERSFCATAFSTHAVTESLLLLHRDEDSPELIRELAAQKKMDRKLNSTGKWLLKRFNNNVANQMMAAILSLHNISLFTGKSIYQEEASEKFDTMAAEINRNGYFSEYGGFDIGYSSITGSCLAWYAEKIERRDEVMEILHNINSKIAPLIDEFGNYDYTSTSRNTQYLYPFGFFKKQSDVARQILNGIIEHNIITPLWLDDRYCIALAIDYLKTYIESK